MLLASTIQEKLAKLAKPCIYGDASYLANPVESFRQVVGHVNLFSNLRHFEAREDFDSVCKTKAVLMMRHNTGLLGQ